MGLVWRLKSKKKVTYVKHSQTYSQSRLENFKFLQFLSLFSCLTLQEAVEHAQATGHVNFQEYKW